MVKRVFLSISLPETVVNEIERVVDKLKRILPYGIRFVPQENWHITLIFLGNRTEEEIQKLIRSSEKIGSITSPVPVEIDSIAYGPNSRNPRMIWANTTPKTSLCLEKLSNLILQDLKNNQANITAIERVLNGHITLARLADYIDKTKLPIIDFKCLISFQTKNFTLVESELDPKGATYSTIADFKFQE